MKYHALKQQNKCTFPDCGCPEARLCMAGKPNYASNSLNRPPSSGQSKIIAKRREKVRKDLE